ncbi:GNAT family N-acetyltransferase [Rhodococcus sp. (in: high G+C Gram-positive bacteria)]|uniref:GNAT family N-acetyltransferase n=1 Tax=Rhodococcus sp. TaxID=1831 RepID=UPI00388E5EB1
MNIRLRRPGDLAQCVEALSEVHTADGYPHRWPDDPVEWLSPADLDTAWIAEQAGRIAGHLALVGREDAVWVSRLFVRPEARGSHVGERLLGKARERGVLRLDVIEQSTTAIALYERTGWTLLERRPADWIMSDGTRPIERLYISR